MKTVSSFIRQNDSAGNQETETNSDERKQKKKIHIYSDVR